MMSRGELKAWSKEKANGNKLDIWIPIILVSAVSGIGAGVASLNLFITLIMCVVNVGFIIYMVNLIEDKEFKINMLWGQFDNFVNILKVFIVKFIYICLWTLLFIVPGIIKSLEYAMTDYLLADDKYKNMSYDEILALSSKMMNGHKMEYFILGLSFFGRILLVLITLGIYSIWLVPWIQVTMTKFMLDIKNSYE